MEEFAEIFDESTEHLLAIVAMGFLFKLGLRLALELRDVVDTDYSGSDHS